MQSLNLHWHKDQYNLFWSHFNKDILKHPGLEIQLSGYNYDVRGVYIIWAGIEQRTILYVGSGVIKKRFDYHLNRPEIKRYRSQGLYATWATIPYSATRNLPLSKILEPQLGVERFLGIMLNPELSKRFPNKVAPILVKLPEWEQSENPFLRPNYCTTTSRFQSVQRLFSPMEKQRVNNQLAELLAMRTPIKSRWSDLQNKGKQNPFR